MQRVHFFDGDKGGVGKSFCCRAFIQYFLDKGIDFVPVESDRYNPDVESRYSGLPFEFAIFSDDQHQSAADDIVEFAKVKPVTISLPSQVGKPLNRWLKDAVRVAAKYDIQFVRWFVTNDSFETLHLFYVALQEHGSKMPFVLVKNQGVGKEWDLTQVEGLPELMKKLKVREMYLPEMIIPDRNLMDKYKMSFSDVRTSQLFEAHSMVQGRIEGWLQDAYTAFESTGLAA